MGPQLVRKFPAFCGTQRFITAFTKACHIAQVVPKDQSGYEAFVTGLQHG
jgi:hypothetical protein